MPAELHNKTWVCSGIEMPADIPAGKGYGWQITHDFIGTLEVDDELELCTRAEKGEAAGTEGPYGGKFTTAEHEAGARFRLLDDDGNLYYEGLFIHSPDYNEGDLGFEPLRDWGEPNDGCTEIWYECTVENGDKVWAML